ncbi:MAG: deoxyribodipyrimidine photolyase [Planctomycetota bacterium]
MVQDIPEVRVNAANSAPVNSSGDYVLYWMTSARRTRYNFALQRAGARAAELGVPVLIFEALRCDYRWASDRLHQFVIDGMRDNATECADARVTYVNYVEPEVGAGRGLLDALASNACLVVTDDFPCFFLPRMIAAAGRQLPVRLEQVDGNGVLPLRTFEDAHTTAYAFRRAWHKVLHLHARKRPIAEPLQQVKKLGTAVVPAAARKWLEAAPQPEASALVGLPIDHSVEAASTQGGSAAAEECAKEFIDRRLGSYDEDRNKPQEVTTSDLSPYLHFGHISAHEVFEKILDRGGRSPDTLPVAGKGQRSGWWGLDSDCEAFLDQVVTWRELGYHYCFHRKDDYDTFESLPDWARTTLELHADDEREHVYSLEQFDAAATHDDLWNAAQNQLRQEGKIHNYLRMLWGKKILEWTPHPRAALDVMIELNNRYALDGRNPNSYSGIFWTLGRFDRAWGERPIFGKIRYMSSANTARKVRVRDYVERYNEPSLPL